MITKIIVTPEVVCDLAIFVFASAVVLPLSYRAVYKQDWEKGAYPCEVESPKSSLENTEVWSTDELSIAEPMVEEFMETSTQTKLLLGLYGILGGCCHLALMDMTIVAAMYLEPVYGVNPIMYFLPVGTAGSLLGSTGSMLKNRIVTPNTLWLKAHLSLICAYAFHISIVLTYSGHISQTAGLYLGAILYGLSLFFTGGFGQCWDFAILPLLKPAKGVVTLVTCAFSAGNGFSSVIPWALSIGFSKHISPTSQYDNIRVVCKLAVVNHALTVFYMILIYVLFYTDMGKDTQEVIALGIKLKNQAHQIHVTKPKKERHPCLMWLLTVPHNLMNILLALWDTSKVGIPLAMYLGSICSVYPSIFPYDIGVTQAQTKLLIGIFVCGDLISRSGGYFANGAIEALNRKRKKDNPSVISRRSFASSVCVYSVMTLTLCLLPYYKPGNQLVGEFWQLAAVMTVISLANGLGVTVGLTCYMQHLPVRNQQVASAVATHWILIGVLSGQCVTWIYRSIHNG